MTDARETPRPTVEEQVRAAQGVLLLVADLLDLQTVAPDYARRSLSPPASATLAALCRRHGDDLAVLLKALPPNVTNRSAR